MGRSGEASPAPVASRREESATESRWRGGNEVPESVPAGLARRRQPGLLGSLHLRERFLGSRAECRARVEVRDVGDVAAVLVAVEDVDVIVAQGSSSNLRASACPPQLETERLNEPAHVRERDVRKVAASEPREEAPRIHHATLPSSADKPSSPGSRCSVERWFGPRRSRSYPSHSRAAVPDIDTRSTRSRRRRRPPRTTREAPRYAIETTGKAVALKRIDRQRP